MEQKGIVRSAVPGLVILAVFMAPPAKAERPMYIASPHVECTYRMTGKSGISGNNLSINMEDATDKPQYTRRLGSSSYLGTVSVDKKSKQLMLAIRKDGGPTSVVYEPLHFISKASDGQSRADLVGTPDNNATIALRIASNEPLVTMTCILSSAAPKER